MMELIEANSLWNCGMLLQYLHTLYTIFHCYVNSVSVALHPVSCGYYIYRVLGRWLYYCEKSNTSRNALLVLQYKSKNDAEIPKCICRQIGRLLPRTRRFFQRALGSYTWVSEMRCRFTYGSSGAVCVSSGAAFIIAKKHSNGNDFRKCASFLLTRTVASPWLFMILPNMSSSIKASTVQCVKDTFSTVFTLYACTYTCTCTRNDHLSLHCYSCKEEVTTLQCILVGLVYHVASYTVSESYILIVEVLS